MTTTTLVRWGNGQGIRLTKAMTEQAGIHIGDRLDIHVTDGRITVTPAASRHIGIPDYASMFRDYTGPQPTEDGFAKPAGEEHL